MKCYQKLARETSRIDDVYSVRNRGNKQNKNTIMDHLGLAQPYKNRGAGAFDWFMLPKFFSIC